MHRPEVFYYPDEAFHCVIGIAHDSGTQEKPFDIVTAVKLDREVHQFRHRQCGTGNIVAAAIDTVGAIEHAVICQHDLQQRNPLSLYHYEGCSY